ncbi:hypothetical protein D3C76_1797700 [compost metagenome]
MQKKGYVGVIHLPVLLLFYYISLTELAGVRVFLKVLVNDSIIMDAYVAYLEGKIYFA